MGMDCQGRNEDGVSMTWWTWHRLLTTAREHGWEPTGTQACDESSSCENGSLVWPEEAPVDEHGLGLDSYMRKDNRLVEEEDATGLADALERAIHRGALEDDSSQMAQEALSDGDIQVTPEIALAVERACTYRSLQEKRPNAPTAADVFWLEAAVAPSHWVRKKAVQLTGLARRGAFSLL